MLIGRALNACLRRPAFTYVQNNVACRRTRVYSRSLVLPVHAAFFFIANNLAQAQTGLRDPSRRAAHRRGAIGKKLRVLPLRRPLQRHLHIVLLALLPVPHHLPFAPAFWNWIISTFQGLRIATCSTRIRVLTGTDSILGYRENPSNTYREHFGHRL